MYLVHMARRFAIQLMNTAETFSSFFLPNTCTVHPPSLYLVACVYFFYFRFIILYYTIGLLYYTILYYTHDCGYGMTLDPRLHWTDT